MKHHFHITILFCIYFFSITTIFSAYSSVNKTEITKKTNASNLFDLGNKLFEEKKIEQAASIFEQALSLEPNNHLSCFTLGYIYHQLGKVAQSLHWFENFLKLRPNNKNVLLNAGLQARRLTQNHKALSFYKKVLELDPESESAHFGLGQVYLMLGDLEKGFPEFELGRKTILDKYNFNLKDASEISGKTILIAPHMGLGDGFQFIRYAKLIKEHGGTVWAHPHWPLVELFKRCPYIDKVFNKNEKPTTGFDFKVSPISLPAVFKTTEQTIPCEIPYLYADEKLTKLWKTKLSSDTNFKIGLFWKRKSDDRCISVEAFESLTTIEGVSFYSLQQPSDNKELENLSFKIHQFGNDFDKSHGGFMDTAAVMKNLDLIISIDTSVPHLAGAMGVPVWLLLIHAADWRWMLNRDDTPWYPNMKLFRQQTPNDWKSVLTKIKEELQIIVGQNNK